MLAQPGRSGRRDARRDDAETVAAPCADNKSGQADAFRCPTARSLSVPWFRDRESRFVSHRPPEGEVQACADDMAGGRQDPHLQALPGK